MLRANADLHHVTWVVDNLDAALAALAPLFGPSPVIREELAGRGVTTARVRCGPMWLVFVQPLAPGVPAERLAAAGEGPLLVSFRVPSLDEAIATLTLEGVRASGTPRRGVAGWRVVDLDVVLPGGVTVQLCEDDAAG